MELHPAPSVYSDLGGLAALKRQAAAAPREALHEVARQFEAIFVNMMLKSMREATPEGGLFGGDQMEAYRDMFDKQLSLDLAAQGGIGLAPIIERQLQSPAGRLPQMNHQVSQMDEQRPAGAGLPAMNPARARSPADSAQVQSPASRLLQMKLQGSMAE